MDVSFIIWLVCALLVIAAILGLVRAVLAVPPFNQFAPYTNVIYALIVLLCVLVLVQGMMGGPIALPLYPHRAPVR